MRWSFWIELQGATKLWVASIVFILVGALIAFVVPPLVQPSQDRDLVMLLLRVLGGTFLVLGFAVLLPMIASLLIAAERRELWYTRIDFIARTERRGRREQSRRRRAVLAHRNRRADAALFYRA